MATGGAPKDWQTWVIILIPYKKKGSRSEGGYSRVDEVSLLDAARSTVRFLRTILHC